jgi:hypothetical protein
VNRRGRLRWWAAHRLNRLPWTCWVDLVDWALDGRARQLAAAVRPRAQQSCRADRDTLGCCYCGKLRADLTAALIELRETEQ